MAGSAAGLRSWASSSTRAGPKENQLLAGTVSSRLGGTRPPSTAGVMPRASASATSSGTSGSGTANSIGTNTACVGTVNPEPTSILMRPATAIARHVERRDREREAAFVGSEEDQRDRRAGEASSGDQFPAPFGDAHPLSLALE